MLVEEQPESVRPYHLAPPLLILQHQDTLACPLVEPPMTNEVEDMICLAPCAGITQAMIESCQGRPLQEPHPNFPLLAQRAKGTFEAGLLPFHVQTLVITRAGNHHQQPQGEIDPKRANLLGYLDITDDQ